MSDTDNTKPTPEARVREFLETVSPEWHADNVHLGQWYQFSASDLRDVLAALEAAEREKDTQKRRADEAWETLETNWWRNHYDELADQNADLAAVIAGVQCDDLCASWEQQPCSCWKSSVDTGAVLAERDAEKWDEGWVARSGPNPARRRADNPYREEPKR